MPIDTSIQFNGHNSYCVTETVFCDPFGVEGMAYVTHSFNAYAASALGAATRARTRFFNAAGAIVGTTDHSFAVGVIFAEVDITVAVPGTAVLCQMSFITSSTWWVAEPKSEEGQTATPYNTNYQGQLSMITPDGAYLGFLTTAQIVVAGTIANPTEGLDTRLVTINNNAINLTAISSSHGSRLTSIEAGAITLAATDTAHGNRLTSIEAGVIVVSGSASYAAGYDPTSKETPTGAQAKANAAESNATAVANTKETPAGAQAKVNVLGATLGDLAYEDLVQAAKLGDTVIVGGFLKTDLIQTKSITGAKMADGTVADLQIASGVSATKVTTGRLSSADGNTYFDLNTPELVQNATVNGRAVKVKMSPTGAFELWIAGRKWMYTSDAGVLVTSIYDVNEDGVVDEKDMNLIFDYILYGTGYLPRMDVDGNGVVNSSDLNLVYQHAVLHDHISLGNYWLGVDATGFYKSTNRGATKTYF